MSVDERPPEQPQSQQHQEVAPPDNKPRGPPDLIAGAAGATGGTGATVAALNGAPSWAVITIYIISAASASLGLAGRATDVLDRITRVRTYGRRDRAIANSIEWTTRQLQNSQLTDTDREQLLNELKALYLLLP